VKRRAVNIWRTEKVKIDFGETCPTLRLIFLQAVCFESFWILSPSQSNEFPLSVQVFSKNHISISPISRSRSVQSNDKLSLRLTCKENSSLIICWEANRYRYVMQQLNSILTLQTRSLFLTKIKMNSGARLTMSKYMGNVNRWQEWCETRYQTIPWIKILKETIMAKYRWLIRRIPPDQYVEIINPTKPSFPLFRNYDTCPESQQC